MLKLTEAKISGLPIPAPGPKGAHRERIYFDPETRGFGLRITSGGTRAFVLNYKFQGLQRRYTIGKWPEWKVERARREAGELRVRIDKGEDPMRDRERAASAESFSELCDSYLTEYAEVKKRTAKQDRLLIDKYLKPAWGRRKAHHIDTGDVERLHRKVSATAPYQANRLLSLISGIFKQAIRWKMVESNPAQGVEKNIEHRRERPIGVDERARLAVVLNEYRNRDAVAAIRLALLTGARRGEILGAQFEQFDLDNGIWLKPPTSTKQKRWHRVPLSQEAILIVKERRKLRKKQADLFAFRDIKKHWEAIKVQADIRDLRFHDLRHDFASRIASSGRASLPIIGRLLGHTSSQTTERYAHLFDAPLREAVEHLSTGSKKRRKQKL
jgi:integrase